MQTGYVPTVYVPTVDPAHDKEVSRQGPVVVLYCDPEEIRLLTYVDEIWFISGYGSIDTSKSIPGVDFYYNKVGYLYGIGNGYAALSEDDPISLWGEIYEEIAYCLS